MEPAAVSSNKRQRLASPTSPPSPPPIAEQTKRKMGQRKTPFSGQPRTCAILMRPTPDQKRELKRAFAAKRYAYNWANHRVRDEGAYPNWAALKKEWNAVKKGFPAWLGDVSTHFMHGGIIDLCNAYASNIAKRKKGKTALPDFKVQYQSLRNKTMTPTEVLTVPNDPVEGQRTSPLLYCKPLDDLSTASSNQRVECLAYFGKNLEVTGPIRLQDKPAALTRLLAEGDRLKVTSKIHWDKRTDTFHFLHAYDAPPPPGLVDEPTRIVSLDPGTRPFQAWYSPTSGEHGELLGADRQKLYAKCLALDRLQSRVDRRAKRSPRRSARQHRQTTKRLKRKLARERRRVHGWVKGAHYDAANFLLERHDLVIAPVLEVKKLADTKHRSIHSKVARAMYTWSHYSFRERLKSAAFRYPGRMVIELVTERDKAGNILVPAEPGTSKTCGLCGNWHADLGASMRFDCPACSVGLDRQLNGARNNFLAAYGRAAGIHAST